MKHDLFAEFRKEAREQMAALVENPVADTPDGMTDAKAYVYRHGNCNDKAKADAIFDMWMWAYCEMWYHEQKAASEEK